MSVANGDTLAGRYRIDERLAGGGMGEVFVATDLELERRVAIKALLPHLAGDEELVARFRREAQTLASLRHRNIVGLYDILSEDGLFLVLELVPGTSLEETLRGGALAWRRCVDIGEQVCAALQAAHTQGVVHRDIKPSNILIEPDGEARVADFGVARLAGATLTEAGASIGTPGYWAPEQAVGELVTAQSDVYSVGAVLFACATGSHPFVGKDGAAAPLMAVTGPVPDPRERNPAVSESAAAVIMTALAKEPEARYPNAYALQTALRATLGEAPRTPPNSEPTQSAPTLLDTAGGADSGAVEHTSLDRPTVLSIAIAGVAVAIALLGGLLVGNSWDRAGDPPGMDIPVQGGNMVVRIPNNWTIREEFAFPDVSLFGGEISASPQGEPASQLIMGRSVSIGPGLLPAAFAHALLAEPARGERVMVGETVMLRYPNLVAPEATGPATFFVAPTADGVQTIICTAPYADYEKFLRQCEAIAATGRPAVNAQLTEPGPTTLVATAASDAIQQINGSRPKIRQRLAAASTRAARRREVIRLATLYERAAQSIGEKDRYGTEGSIIIGGLVSDLESAGDRYRELGEEMTKADTSDRFASLRVTWAEERIEEQLREFVSFGYEVG